MKLKLDPNETIIYECKPHWISFIRPAIIALFCFLLFLTDVSGPSRNLGSSSFFFIVFAISVVWPILKFKTTYLVLTDKRVYARKGIFGTSALTAPYAQINTVSLTRSLIGRVLGYGTLHIHCVTGVYKYAALCNPEEMQNAIINKITK